MNPSLTAAALQRRVRKHGAALGGMSEAIVKLTDLATIHATQIAELRADLRAAHARITDLGPDLERR